MDFAPGQTRRVEVSYLQIFSEYQSWGKEMSTWGRYILITGRLWKGPIGRADVRLRLHGLTREQVELPLMEKPREQGPTAVSWHFEDIEPGFNIDFRVKLTTDEFPGAPGVTPAYRDVSMPGDLRLLDRFVRLVHRLKFIDRADSYRDVGEEEHQAALLGIEDETEALVEALHQAVDDEQDRERAAMGRRLIEELRTALFLEMLRLAERTSGPDAIDLRETETNEAFALDLT